ncbi:pilus assembly protein PilP [Paraburkholderia sp. MMS20-SJTN17]|uniref:Pilus assembly protein PilP n=1 Tax=Paraburkholderia translucens TaxID=2886945 RepID=A0ABS8KL02_9BURK|nr:pilus assembly protein PilP [Paraburkholderia sp. MMS20-SJTN17]MCC8405072.1 pilus assembly protein PilP [Paraburkholderia sp. MMS20-SJTN17]
MSTTFFEPSGAAHVSAGFSQWLKRARVPLEAWSARRRRFVAATLAALVFGFGAYGWSAADLAGLAASRGALAASTQRLADARRALAQLPLLRRAATALPATAPTSVPWSSADDVRIVSELATQSSVALLAVEPGAASGEGVERMRAIQLTARTDFVHLMAFFQGLAQLPVLIVPIDVTIKQDGKGLAVAATLHVYDALRPAFATDAASAGEADDDEDLIFFDPFARSQIVVSGEAGDTAQLRLVGLLRDRSRGLALLDTPDGTTTVKAGQQLGVERVTQLDALGITLTNGGATRTLTLTEAS